MARKAMKMGRKQAPPSGHQPAFSAAKGVLPWLAAGAALIAIAALLLLPHAQEASKPAPQQQQIPAQPQQPAQPLQPSQGKSGVFENVGNSTLVIAEIRIGTRSIPLNATLPPGQPLQIIYSSATSGGSLPSQPGGAASPPASQSGGGNASSAEPLSIATSMLPAAKQDARYSTGLEASGGTGSYSWSVAGLPSGYSASANGVISGVTLEHGTYNLVIAVSDGQSTASKELQLVVEE